MIDLKSDDEVKRMRAACSAAARVLQDLVSLVVPGISTAGLDSAARGLMYATAVKAPATAMLLAA
jgi:methionine aminopeptidase